MKTPDEIKWGLEFCSTMPNPKTCMVGCAYYDRGMTCIPALMTDALAYIRELEAKVAEYERPLRPMPEVEIYGDAPVWLEMRAECDEPRIVDIIPSFVNPAERAEIAFMGQSRRAHLRADHYGNSWRCWPRRPTEGERKAAEWDD